MPEPLTQCQHVHSMCLFQQMKQDDILIDFKSTEQVGHYVKLTISINLSSIRPARACIIEQDSFSFLVTSPIHSD